MECLTSTRDSRLHFGQNSGKFALNWSLPFDDDKLLVSVNNNPQTGPTATGSGSLSNVILTNVADPAETVSATLTGHPVCLSQTAGTTPFRVQFEPVFLRKHGVREAPRSVFCAEHKR